MTLQPGLTLELDCLPRACGTWVGVVVRCGLGWADVLVLDEPSGSSGHVLAFTLWELEVKLNGRRIA